MSMNDKKRENKKIIPIRFPYDASEDPEMDDFLLQNLQEEADEIERRMNADSEFAKIPDPEGQYEKIVARLKEMGEWEEAGDGEDDEIAENGADKDGIGGADSTDIKMAAMAENASVTDEIYALLSEDDRQALELGRQQQRRQEKKKARSARLLRAAKRGGVVAAAFVLLFTVSMNVDASRRVILQMWDTVAEAFTVRTATDNLEDSVESTMAASMAAMEEIKETTGIPGLEFVYWPKGMEYLQYEIQDGDTETFVFYSYGEKILNLYMRKVTADSTNYLVTDQDTEFVETLENWSGVNVNIWKVNPTEEMEQYQAEFEYESYRYMIYGFIPLEELEEMVKGMDFLV